MPESTTPRSRNVLISLVILFLVIGMGIYWYSAIRTTTSSGDSAADKKIEFVLKDKIENWQLKGLYTGNKDLEKKAHADIERLNGLFGGEEFTDYILYVSIAGQYEFLGDGAKEYEYLLRAIEEDSTKTGLAWYNLGTLLVRLGAFNDARVAFSNAATVQPDVDQYSTRHLEFLTQQFPNDKEAIEKAFTAASAVLGESPTLLEIRARWLEATGRIGEAIAHWQRIMEMSPGSGTSVETEIKRLRGKL
ncbi:hypothetical protein A2763_00315 [Candidatus Kaiserbacteria bacterium RIFCSPHIGHO2_01_FULL_54_36]|uniref:Uncharacterized protein n=1 Tax=Candidatus Kaiserbacteria bacterium RIFCSPHIGHO2_01_FULL_54_36 TaxID=1798482 RepID=A0A1F6CLQ2_9BACT|nr:MAG: hypothetical protein A2763_00315 [Candidatus Kaiserbacteria bacterium RIFCSPHIGHO2_01_FULL_54_36]OGG75681.1 MAG: hypothetical protein A3A41_04730 [Candidatus Kaiserbacteria bacterium RIFCSPLOWO2_01_FULL_54_22]